VACTAATAPGTAPPVILYVLCYAALAGQSGLVTVLRRSGVAPSGSVSSETLRLIAACNAIAKSSPAPRSLYFSSTARIISVPSSWHDVF
jgi:hypothetical protein